MNIDGFFPYKGKDLKGDLKLIKELRNCISHNRIVLETEYNSEINALRKLLPNNYVKGFEKDITDSMKDLCISEDWSIIFDDDYSILH